MKVSVRQRKINMRYQLYNLFVSALQPQSFPMRRAVTALWYVALALALFILALSLPGYARQVSNHALEPIDAPAWFVLIVRAFGALASLGTAVVSLALAVLLFVRKRRERMALFASFYLIGYGILLGGPMEALVWIDPRMPQLALYLQAVLLTTPTILLLAWFPNGMFVPRWMRYVVLSSLVFFPIPLFFSNERGFESNPMLTLVANVLLIGLAVIGIGAQIYRYRRVSTAPERQQTKWFVLGLTIWIALFILVTIPYIALQNYPADGLKPWWTPLTATGWWLTLMVLPLSLTLAVLRYRLWDVDLLLNRALVYGAMTGLVVGLYILIVASLSALFQSNTNLLASLLATGIVAVLFQPLRERVQRTVNRFLYGERDEPYRVLTKLGQRLEAALEPDAVLPAIVETVAQTMKLPYAAIQTGADGRALRTAYGKPETPHAALTKIPLIYQNETVGALFLATRAGQEKFSDADMRLLDDFARQAGVAVHAVRLNADLQESRARIVSEREQERRRIRRDLHDGLGPALASLTLKLDAARNLLMRDPRAADEILAESKTHTQTALADIRRLVYDLRPPALDELGLLGALREQVLRYTGANDLQIEMDVPDALPPLSAAVEVAAYRIATEALTNVVEHAHAKHCRVEIECRENILRVQVQDDGLGLAEGTRRGVGLNSMRERAQELGGACVIEKGVGSGTRVTARLPLVNQD